MKAFFLILFFTFSISSFAQDNYIVKTEDGRRVLLKADFTWEYIDALQPKNTAGSQKKGTKKLKEVRKNNCRIAANFTEPKLNNKIQAQLKRGRATIKHIKKKVAKEYNCTIEEVILLSASETKQSGLYDFCANGTKVRYKRVGNSIAKPLKIF